jgi:hypothetical protein
MGYEEDFVKDEIVEFDVEGRKFKYKPTTAGDENEWIDEYMEIGESGKAKPNLKKVNECKIRNLVEVPYDEKTIANIIGISKAWKDLSNEEKWKLMSKLKPETFNKIITSMNKIDSPNEELKKN